MAAEAWGLTIGASLLAGVWLGPWAIPTTLGALLALHLIRGTVSYKSLIVATVAVIVGAARGGGTSGIEVPPDLHLAEQASGQIAGIPKASPGGIRADFRLDRVNYGDGRDTPASFMVLLWLPDATDVGSGDHISVNWTVTPIDRLPPGFARYVASRGAVASAYAWEVTVGHRGNPVLRFLGDVQEHLTSRLRTVVPGDAGSLAAGIVTGNDAAMGENARAAFLQTGTTHITAVSGSNVVMLVALWNLVLRSNRTRRVLVIQLVIVVSIWLYSILAGLEPSAVRAAIVATLGIFAGRFGRKADPLTILTLTIGGMALWDPGYTRMVGFWLSVIASFAFVSRLPASGAATLRSGVIGSAQGVLLAQVATLPLVLATFGTWSVSGIFANLLIQPVLSVAFPLTFALALVVLVAPAIAPVVAWIPAVLLELVIAIVLWLAPRVAPIHIEGERAIAVLGVGVPCGLIVIAANQDAGRWARIMADRWPQSPRAVAVMLLIPLAGIVLAVIAATMI